MVQPESTALPRIPNRRRILESSSGTHWIEQRNTGKTRNTWFKMSEMLPVCTCFNQGVYPKPPKGAPTPQDYFQNLQIASVL